MFEKLKKTLPVRILGDSVLAGKAKPVTKIDEELFELGEKMIQTMYKHDGVGLAAPQVGVSLRMFALHIYPPEDENGNPLSADSPGERELLPKMPLVLVNPVIVSRSEVQETRDEGCLSVPGLWAPVTRPVSVVLKAEILGGEKFELECGGLLARAIQHENDHLDGVVFVQRLSDDAFYEIKPKMDKIVKKSGKKNFKLKRLKS